MKRILIIISAAILVLLAGCASPSAWRECETHLVPINAPAPAHPTGSHP